MKATSLSPSRAGVGSVAILKASKPSLLVIAALLAACGAEGDDPAPNEHGSDLEAESASLPPSRHAAVDLRKEKVLANLVLPNRDIVFYEMEDGAILEIDHGVLDDNALPPSEPDGLDSAQRYAFLSGKAVPSALAKAQERVREARRSLQAQDPSPPTEPAGDSTTESTSFQKENNWLEGPADVASRDWFRERFCQPVNRFDSYLSGMGNRVWNKARLAYFRAGIYAKYSNETTIKAGLYYKSAGTDFQHVADLQPNAYIAMRAESNAQAYARAEVTEADFFPSGSKPDDVYDICINYHF